MYSVCAPVRTYRSLNVNIYETDKEILLEAELPGRKREDVTLELADRTLTLRLPETDMEREGYKLEYVEHRRGAVERSFKLGSNLDGDRIQARFENGLLLVTIPRTAEAQARKVEIA